MGPGEPVRDRMVALTRSMSAATSSTRRSIEAFEGLSKGTITATPVSTFAEFALSLGITIESAAQRGKGMKRLTSAFRPGPEDERRTWSVRELVRTNDMVLVS